MTGTVYGVGSHGYFWSAVPLSASYSCDLSFTSSTISPLGSRERSEGYAVRPVQE